MNDNSLPYPCNVVFLPNSNILFSTEQAIIIPVNCVGVMGAGLALYFKELYPEGFEIYKKQCRSGELSIGRVSMAVLNNTTKRPLKVFFVPTKDHWHNPSTIEIINASLNALRNALIDRALIEGAMESLAIPKLGCGLGQLKWEIVYPLIRQFISSLDSTVVRNMVIYGQAV